MTHDAIKRIQLQYKQSSTLQKQDYNKWVFPLISPGLPFTVKTIDEEPQEKRAQQMVKWTRKHPLTKKVDKNTCNKCNKRSSSTGHILCIKCHQWQHLKCVGLNLSEAKLKKAAFKCEECRKKNTMNESDILDMKRERDITHKNDK